MLNNAKNNKLHYVSVTCIVIKEGKYLIVKRSDKEKVFPSKWTVPGGKLEVSDYINYRKHTKDAWYGVLEMAIKREVFEEVGIEIEDIKYLTSLSFIRPDGIPTIVLSLYGKYKAGNIKLSDELVDFRWITADEVSEYDLIEGIGEEIIALDKYLKGEINNPTNYIIELLNKKLN